LLAWLYFLYFVLPFYGIRLGSMTVGVLGLSLYYSGYLAEVFKAGIDAIPKGQSEAARALSLSRRDALIYVIAPQMLRNIAAPLGNYFVSILKATPYLAVLAVPEMLGRAFDIASKPIATPSRWSSPASSSSCSPWSFPTASNVWNGACSPSAHDNSVKPGPDHEHAIAVHRRYPGPQQMVRRPPRPERH
jgi:hypothetical protein